MRNKKEVVIKYENGNTRTTTYEDTDLYCPNCGKQEVWEEQGFGDYYLGVDYACTNCYASFNLPYMETNEGSETGEQLIKQLKP